MNSPLSSPGRSGQGDDCRGCPRRHGHPGSPPEVKALCELALFLTEDFGRATEWIMIMQHPLRAPDALHLAVATRQNAVFWTLDKTLAKAQLARSKDTEVGYVIGGHPKVSASSEGFVVGQLIGHIGTGPRSAFLGQSTEAQISTPGHTRKKGLGFEIRRFSPPTAQPSMRNGAQRPPPPLLDPQKVVLSLKSASCTRRRRDSYIEFCTL